MKNGIRAAIGIALLSANASASAHHSFAMFDNQKQIKLNGMVSRFDWTNPHVYIKLVTDDGKEWTLECATPGILKRAGWTFKTVKVGDKVSAVVAPLHSGEPGALLKELVASDGRSYNDGRYAGPPEVH
jgi:hypothetical protein